MADVPAGFTYLDNSFYTLSAKLAKQICDGQLPKHGYEKLVFWEGKHWWVARTIHKGEQVWSIRDAGGWKLRNGIGVLSTADL